MDIAVIRMTETAKLPERGSDEAAGYDLFADVREKTILKPQEGMLVPTGLKMAIPSGYFGGVYARSGLSIKEGLRPANCTGVIDSDYRGELKVPLYNDSNVARTIEPGEKIAQLIIQPYLNVAYHVTKELDETARGEGGFGSTGK